MYLIETFIKVLMELSIKIGDIVISLFSFPIQIFHAVFYDKKRRLKKGEFKLPSRKIAQKQTTAYTLKAILIAKIIFMALFYFFTSLFKNILIVLISFPKPILQISIKLFQSYSSYRARKLAYKIQEERRAARIKHKIFRPSIFYKLKYVLIGFILSSVFIFLPLLSFIFVSDLPNLSDLSINSIPKTTKILDRNSTLLYEIYVNQNRTIVRLSDVPKNLKDATIAIEDKDFYTHPGFDLKGIIRALITNIQSRGFQGGSTITQQLIKSAFLTPDPTIVRKLREIVLAFWAERVYSKDQILELYLNYVPYGGTAWGVVSAADVYFGKKISELDLAEAAFLAGLPQSPSAHSPFFNNNGLWKKRQKEVLTAMARQGYITQKEADEMYSKKLEFRNQEVPLRAPHFVMYVRNLLVKRYGLSEVERGGLTIRTSLDLSVQEEAEKIVLDEVERDAYLNIGNGAALIITPQNGDILAMVGSRNYFDTERDGNVNLTTSLRQPGSAIKLVTYSLALSRGYTEATILDDTPLTIYIPGSPVYSPVNYDGLFHGKIPLRTAFANSFNIPPVRLAQKFGPDAIREYGEKMGILSWKGIRNYGVSITLGGVEIRMIDIATAYAVMANGGNRIDPDPILEVHDSYGRAIYKKKPVPIPVVDPGIAFIISDILADNNARRIEFGLNTPLEIPGARVSVKTGTTDNKRDNWTIGYTPSVLVATWVGNNDNSPMNQALASGITGAAPMWNKLMTMMLERIGASSTAIIPQNVVKKYCLGQDRYFIKGTENSVSCFMPTPSVSPSPQVNSL